MAFDGTEAVAGRRVISFAATRWTVPAITIIAVLLTAIPIFLSRMPPVMDFPNHLTRIWLIAEGAHERPLSLMYEVRWWQAATNVGVDFVGSQLIRIVGLAATSKLLLFMMLLGPALGAVSLNRAVFGRLSAWHLASVMLVWGTTAVEGFMSFQIGLAAGLFCAVAMRPLVRTLSWRGLAAIAACATVLLVIHPFAIAMFLAALAGLALDDRVAWNREWLQRRAMRIALLTGACMIPVAALYLFASHPPGAYNQGVRLVHWNPITETIKPKHLVLLYASPFLSYRVLWDALALAPLIALVVWATVAGRLRTHAGLLLVAAVLAAIAPTLPTNIGDGAALPIRLPIMAALLALAGTSIEFQSKQARTLFAVVLVTAALFRVGSIAWTWHQREHDVDELRVALRDIPQGVPVMIIQQKWHGNAPLGRLVAGCPGMECAAERHFGSLVVLWRHAFIPELFTVPGQHPLGVRPPWDKIAVHSSGIPYADEVAPSPSHDRFLRQWWKRFDYVLLLDADLGRTTIPHTQLVADSGFARLYRAVPGPASLPPS